MTSVELVIGASAAIVMALGFLFVAHAVAWYLCRACDTTTRWVGIVAALAWLPTVLFHLLASRRAFSRPVAVAVIVLLAAVTWRVTGAAVLRQRLYRDRVFLRRLAARLRRSPYRIAVLAFVVCVMPPVLRAIVLPPLGWDTLTYHSVKAAMWVQHGGANQMNGIGPWAYYRDMPGGAEVFRAWAMLPTSSDVFTGLLDIVEWLAVGLSAMVLARRIGVREPFASTAAGFVLAIPATRLMLGSGYSELCLLSTCLAGLGLAVAADRTRPGVLMLAGAALGVSAATKLPMIVVTGVPLLLLMLHFLLHGPRHRGRWVVAALAAYGVAVVPWFVTATLDTGAPFSPAPIALGSLVLGKAPPEFVWYLDRSIRPMSVFARELAILQGVFSPPSHGDEGAGLFSLIPIAALWIGLVPIWRRNRVAALLLMSAMVACVATYYAPTFTIIRYYWSANSSRFLLPAIAIATVMGVSWCRRRSLMSRWFCLLLLSCALWNLVEYALVGFSRVSEYASAAVLGALVILVAGCYGISRLRHPIVRLSLTACVAVLGVIALQGSRDVLRDSLFKNDFALHWFADWRYWAPAVAAVDEPATKFRIAVTSGPFQNNDHWFAYPFMGRRLQNDLVYVPISGDGHMRHFGRGGLNEELVRTANFWAWRQRLLRQKVTHVLTFGPTSTELEWMEADPADFERIGGVVGDSWGVFRVKA